MFKSLREINCNLPRETRASFRFWEGHDSSFEPGLSEVEGCHKSSRIRVGCSR
jgi:hypothetical protein